MKKLVLVIFCLALGTATFAQKSSEPSKESLEAMKSWEDTLALLSYAIINDSLAEYRFAACRKMIPSLVQALKTQNSFHYPFERLQSVSIQYPQDSSFRIFTWQLYVDKDEYRYYGAIQMNNSELKLFPLIDRSFNIANVEQAELSADNWYGSVYYKILESESPSGKYYLLFGFDGYEFFNKRKIVEVLHFQDDKPAFGAPVFVQQEPGKPIMTKNRLMLEYSAAASVRLNYDEAMEILIFDHLIPAQGQYGEGMTMIPDGSYEGYIFEKGVWVYKSKIFDQISDEAPRPYPLLDSREKDIFGKKGKN